MDNKELFGNVPSIITNPFQSESIWYVNLEAMKLSTGWKITGKVRFRNESTEGCQNFEADTLGELYLKIQEFVNSMK